MPNSHERSARRALALAAECQRSAVFSRPQGLSGKRGGHNYCPGLESIGVDKRNHRCASALAVPLDLDQVPRPHTAQYELVPCGEASDGRIRRLHHHWIKSGDRSTKQMTSGPRPMRKLTETAARLPNWSGRSSVLGKAVASLP